jgi:hypothetical protein
MAYCLVMSELAPARREIISIFHKVNPHWTFLESAEFSFEHDAFAEHNLEYALIVDQMFSQALLDQVVQLRIVSPEVKIILFLHDMPESRLLQVLHANHIRVQSYHSLNEGLSMVASV